MGKHDCNLVIVCFDLVHWYRNLVNNAVCWTFKIDSLLTDDLTAFRKMLKFFKLRALLILLREIAVVIYSGCKVDLELLTFQTHFFLHF